MFINVSDSDIRMDVRSYLAQHRIDTGVVQLHVFGGTVRMSGAVCHLGGKEQPVPLRTLESLEREIVMTRGVRHAYFDFSNWRRLENGQWEAVSPIRQAAGRRPALDEELEEISTVD